MSDFYESPEEYPSYFAMPWGAIEYGKDLPIRITIMNTTVLAALEQLSGAEGIGDEPEDYAANLVAQHLSKWLDDVERTAS